jgi:hypothetical protein
MDALSSWLAVALAEKIGAGYGTVLSVMIIVSSAV